MKTMPEFNEKEELSKIIDEYQTNNTEQRMQMVKKKLLKIAKEYEESDGYISQLIPLEKAIKDGNYLLAWQILLYNIYWLKFNDINYPDNIEELAKNTSVKFHNNGIIYKKYKTKNLMKHGLYKKWHYNGKLHIKCKYKNDMLHGLYEQWHDNRNLYMKCTYINGVLDGLYEKWDENGKLIEKYEYKQE